MSLSKDNNRIYHLNKYSKKACLSSAYASESRPKLNTKILFFSLRQTDKDEGELESKDATQSHRPQRAHAKRPDMLFQ